MESGIPYRQFRLTVAQYARLTDIAETLDTWQFRAKDMDESSRLLLAALAVRDILRRDARPEAEEVLDLWGGAWRPDGKPVFEALVDHLVGTEK